MTIKIIVLEDQAGVHTEHRTEHIMGPGPFELCATTRGLSNVLHYFDQPTGSRVYVDEGDWVVEYPDGFRGKLNDAMFQRIFGD